MRAGRCSTLAVHVVVGCMIAWGSAAAAGEFNRVLSIGDRAPAWRELPAVDGSQHSLDDLQEADVVVVVFTCNSCPYAVDAEERLVALDKWLRERDGALVAINVNKIEADQLPAMRRRAEERGFTFPYLYDESQQIAKQFGATTTPEFYVLDRERQIVYMGSLDDSPDGKDVSKRYVRDAVSAVIGNEAASPAETVPIGCRIRFERTRRGR